MKNRPSRFFFHLVAILSMATTFSVRSEAEDTPTDNIGHPRHFFRHGEPFPTEPASEARFTTTRTSEIALALPKKDDSFTFVVFGDRTSGQDSHVSVLADAVHDVNLIEPDMVMCVGDMVQGYNTTEPWLRQMKEYREIMDRLKCPWFPTAGNHDVYGGDRGKKYQNEENYEMHFGPLWYAFEHKNCWFVVLFTDEGNRETGAKNFSDPELQKMTPEQFQWLERTLEKAKDADHVFVFQHQPRWQNRGNYGDDWDRIHKLFVDAGNVRAVFGGHTHTMRYEKRDAIEYFTLSTTGGNFAATGIPRIGYQDNYFLLNVRKDRFGVTVIPVASTIDPREMDPVVLGELRKLQNLKFSVTAPALAVGADGLVDGATNYTLTNTTPVPLDAVLEPVSGDSRWETSSYPQRARLEPGEKKEFAFPVKRPDHSLDKAFREPVLRLSLTAHLKGMAVPIPEIDVKIPLGLDAALEKRRQTEQLVLKLGGREDRMSVPSVKLDAGAPFTIETWFRADELDGTRTLAAKGRDRNEIALSLVDGTPRFHLPLENRRTTLDAPKEIRAEKGRWHHIAGVFDGTEIRLCFDGKTVANRKAERKFTAHTQDAVLGATVDSHGNHRFALVGALDSLRISKTARYGAEEFQPERDFAVDAETLLLLDMQQGVGKWLAIPERKLAYGVLEADAQVVPQSTLP